MVKKVLAGVAVGLAVLLGVVAMQPSNYRITRATTVNAPAAVVLAHLEDFHRWKDWSPWAKMDPNQKETYSGAPKGKGAVYHWAGNDEVGEGEMTITNVTAERLDVALSFIRPFPSQSTVDIVLKPTSAGTEVTWGMDGTNTFLGKAFGLVVNMDEMLGNDFNKGLAGLKSLSEADAATASPVPAPPDAAAAGTAPAPTGTAAVPR